MARSYAISGTLDGDSASITASPGAEIRSVLVHNADPTHTLTLALDDALTILVPPLATIVVPNDTVKAEISGTGAFTLLASTEPNGLDFQVPANDGALMESNNLSDLPSAATARTNLGLGTVATLASDVDGTLAANSDVKVATQKATKTYADTKATQAYADTKASNVSALVSNGTAGDWLPTAAQIVNSRLLATALDADRNIVLPSAALIIAAATLLSVGESFLFHVAQTFARAATVTDGGDANITLVGNMVVGSAFGAQSGAFAVLKTAAGALTVVRAS